MDALQKIDEAKNTIAMSVDELVQQAQEKTEHVQALTEKAITTEKLYREKAKNHAAVLADLDKQLTSKKLDLKAIDTQLVDAQARLRAAKAQVEAAEKRHADFTAYEQRSMRALEAREESVIKKEASLDNIIGEAKRRTRVLSEF